MSNAADAPLLGEAAVLYNLSQPVAPGFAQTPIPSSWRDVPGVVWLVLALQWLLGIGGLWRAARILRRRSPDRSR